MAHLGLMIPIPPIISRDAIASKNRDGNFYPFLVLFYFMCCFMTPLSIAGPVKKEYIEHYLKFFTVGCL